MSFFRKITIGTKIQFAIASNVIFAIFIAEYLIHRTFGLSGAQGIVVNLLINSTIAFLYGMMVSRAITKPIREQVAILKLMTSGAGDLTQRLEKKSDDEIGELSGYFNEFVSQLHGMISQLSSNIQALHSSFGYFDQIGETIAEGAKLQEVKTRKMVDEIGQISKYEESTAETSIEAEAIAIRTEESACSGQNLVTANIKGMETLKRDMLEISSALENLKASVETISEIVVDINQISDQTNLLALNAAIEAARAGDQGRGFAVVADEVRTLAQRASDATTHINEIIENIKGAVTQLSAVIDEGGRQVEKQVETSNEAGAKLTEIEKHSRMAAERIKGISQSAAHQLEIANEFIKEINAIAAIADNNGESVYQVVNFSRDVREQIIGLNRVIDKFKL